MKNETPAQLPALAFDWGINNGLIGFVNGLTALIEALLIPITLLIELFTSLFGGSRGGQGG